ncbi:hypothetical protein GCM10009800_41390 [Nocardiopsis rhodophaea]
MPRPAEQGRARQRLQSSPYGKSITSRAGRTECAWREGQSPSIEKYTLACTRHNECNARPIYTTATIIDKEGPKKEIGSLPLARHKKKNAVPRTSHWGTQAPAKAPGFHPSHSPARATELTDRMRLFRQ